MRIADDHPLPAGVDQPLPLPLAEGPADGIQGRTAHLGQVLARNVQVDQDPLLDLAAHLPRQPEQDARQAPFHPLGRQRADLALELVDPRRHDPHGIHGHLRVEGDQAGQRWLVPGKRLGVGGRLGAGRVAGIRGNSNQAEDRPGTDDVEDHLLPIRGDLAQLDLPAGQQVGMRGRVFLLEEKRTGRGFPDPAGIHDRADVRRTVSPRNRGSSTRCWISSEAGAIGLTFTKTYLTASFYSTNDTNGTNATNSTWYKHLAVLVSADGVCEANYERGSKLCRDPHLH